MRYRFYRAHKYLIFLFFELERMIAKTDFRIKSEVITIKEQVENLSFIMQRHAAHEDQAIHILLKKQNSPFCERTEIEHEYHEKQFLKLQNKLAIIINSPLSKKLSLGYDFYLFYRVFLMENLKHFYEEETILMAELHKFYTDEELKNIDRQTYQQMTPEHMIAMLKTLSPHMDASDKEFFLAIIKETEPEKFKAIENQIN